MEINHLENLRYSITNIVNGKSLALIHPMQASLTVTMSATYQQLINAHLARLRNEGQLEAESQVVRNHLTAIRAYLKTLRKSETSPIGEEFSSEYSGSVARHLGELSISQRSKSDRRSLLNSWRTTFDMMGVAPEVCVRGRERRRADVSLHTATPFEKGLKEALRNARLAPKRAAILAGISPSALGRWTRGALPNLRSTETLKKLELVLGLPSGHLTGLLAQTMGTLTPHVPNHYRERQRERCKLDFRFKVNELSIDFRNEWSAFLAHKTNVSTGGGKRYKNGRWTATSGVDTPHAVAGINTVGQNYYASAQISWGHVSSYLGFLRLPIDQGGYGVDSANVQTLAWLVVPDAIDSYLHFQEERSEGLKHTGHAIFCGLVASLAHPEHGYLAQQSMLHKLPQAVVCDSTWEELCDKSLKTAREWKSASTDISRDPTKPIQFLLDQEQPLKPIVKAMRELRLRGDNALRNSIEEAIARRDELLLGLLMSNPLRKKNIVELTYRPDNSGNVYQSAAGEWRIRLLRTDFKSGRARKKRSSREYDVRVASWLSELISDYVTHFRPILARSGASDRFFLSRKGRSYDDLTKRVSVLTKELIPGSGGFGPHAFRHLVATDWLTKNPNDFLTVAELLNDTLAVVMSTYAHLKQDDALTRHATQLEPLMPEYLRSTSLPNR